MLKKEKKSLSFSEINTTEINNKDDKYNFHNKKDLKFPNNDNNINDVYNINK